MVGWAPQWNMGVRYLLVGLGHIQHPHATPSQVPTPGGAQDRLREDVATGCNRFAYTGLKIVKTEPGVNEYEG